MVGERCVHTRRLLSDGGAQRAPAFHCRNIALAGIGVHVCGTFLGHPPFLRLPARVMSEP